MRHATIALQDILANLVRASVNLRRQRIPPPAYVLMDLKGEVPEREASRSPLQRQLPFLRKGLTVEALEHRLHILAGDPAIQGIILDLGALKIGLARLQNIRTILQRFRKQGKRVIIYAPELDLPRYYLGTAADELVIPESSTFDFKGLASQITFLKDTLARLGVNGDFEAIGEYKTAADPIRRSRMSEAHREMINAILDSFFEDLLDAIVEGRKLSRECVRDLIDHAPWTARETIEAGLADSVLYEDQLASHLAHGKGTVRIQHWDQAQTSLHYPLLWHGMKGVGVISLQGVIVPGESRQSPIPLPLMGTQAGSDTLARAFRKAEQDPDIAAILFYIDSPGGSALASDLIWREVKRVSTQKPVVAFMGDVAGSGGYYVATGADHIVAQSATLTGSIGVVGGKIVTGGLYDKLDAHLEIIQRGQHAVMDLPDDPYTQEERQKVIARMQAIYDLFKKRVAEGRDLSLDEVEKVARGRVWTGRQALEIGLIDELGDFNTALSRAKLMAHLPLDESVPVVPIEAPRKYTVPPALTSGQAFMRELAEVLHPFQGTNVLTIMPWTLEIRY